MANGVNIGRQSQIVHDAWPFLEVIVVIAALPAQCDKTGFAQGDGLDTARELAWVRFDYVRHGLDVQRSAAHVAAQQTKLTHECGARLT